MRTEPKFELSDVAFYLATFENALRQPNVFPRDLDDMIKNLCRAYEGVGEIELCELDFCHGMLINDVGQDLGAFVLIFKRKAQIYINKIEKLNECYRRFRTLKEVSHVFLRKAFEEDGKNHPDTNEPSILIHHIEDLINLTWGIISSSFSIKTFNQSIYSDALKVEVAAELLAILLLYPPHEVEKDRRGFLKKVGAVSMSESVARMSSTLEYAEKWMLPQKYVDFLFRWSDWEEFYKEYQEYREKFENHC